MLVSRLYFICGTGVKRFIASMLVLGTEPETSTKATTHNCRTIYPLQTSILKEKCDNFEFTCRFTKTEYPQAMSVTLEDTSVTKILVPLKMATDLLSSQ